MGKHAADAFLDHFDLVPRGSDRRTLETIGAAFARLPYENLTKLIAKHERPAGSERRRRPREVLGDHLALGAGGTCFALTELFGAVLARLGYESRPLLCDAPGRPASHCALLVRAGDEELLVDPGYLLTDPLPLPTRGEAPTSERGVARLLRHDETSLDLYTYDRLRYRLRLDEISPARFAQVWDASFEATMMNGVHLCAAEADGGYAYLHGHKLRLQGRPGAGAVENINLRGREADELAARFGLAPELVARAYALVEAAREARKSEGQP